MLAVIVYYGILNQNARTSSSLAAILNRNTCTTSSLPAAAFCYFLSSNQQSTRDNDTVIVAYSNDNAINWSYCHPLETASATTPKSTASSLQEILYWNRRSLRHTQQTQFGFLEQWRKRKATNVEMGVVVSLWNASTISQIRMGYFILENGFWTVDWIHPLLSWDQFCLYGFRLPSKQPQLRHLLWRCDWYWKKRRRRNWYSRNRRRRDQYSRKHQSLVTRLLSNTKQIAGDAINIQGYDHAINIPGFRM